MELKGLAVLASVLIGTALVFVGWRRGRVKEGALVLLAWVSPFLAAFGAWMFTNRLLGLLLGTLFGPFDQDEPLLRLLARSAVGWVALAVTIGVFTGTYSLMRDGIAVRRSKQC
jgi:hypothetical protein